jgi:hypothetical protein
MNELNFELPADDFQPVAYDEAMERGTLRPISMPVFKVPRVFKVLRSDGKRQIGLMTNGKYAVGVMRQGCELEHGCILADTLDDAKAAWGSTQAGVV